MVLFSGLARRISLGSRGPRRDLEMCCDSASMSLGVVANNPTSGPQYSYFGEDSTCHYCSTLEYTGGVDCSVEGASTTRLPIKAGYWRQTTQSLTVKPCPYPESCLGSIAPDRTIRTITNTDDYCMPGSCGKCESPEWTADY